MPDSTLSLFLTQADQYQSAFLGEADLASPLNEDIPTMESDASEDDHSFDEEELNDGDGGGQGTGALLLAPDIEHFATRPAHKV